MLLALDEHGGSAARGGLRRRAPTVSASGALGLVLELRRAGISADLDLAGRSVKGQMKQADRSGADVTVILDEAAARLARDMETGEQRPVDMTQLAEELAGTQ